MLSTGECELLILDEVLGLLDNGILSFEDLKTIIESKSEDVDIILTGSRMSDEICQIADEIYNIEAVNYKIFEE